VPAPNTTRVGSKGRPVVRAALFSLRQFFANAAIAASAPSNNDESPQLGVAYVGYIKEGACGARDFE
jgi:hypothetical protein